MKLDLHCAVLGTNDEDINWVPFLVVAHSDPLAVDRVIVDKLVKEFYNSWTPPVDESLYDDQRIEDFLDYMDAKGYTVLKPGRLEWFVPDYYSTV